MRAFFLLALALLASGCATRPDIRVQINPDVDFSRYRSFAFYSPLGTDDADYSSFLSQHLRDATRSALETRGYRYDENQPDLLVNFTLQIKDKTDVVGFPTIGYYGYRSRWFGAWNSDVTTIHYQESVLAIHLIDARQKQLLWEGVAESRVTTDARQNPKAAARDRVEHIFSRYTHRAPAARE
jgi:hypothetical protein